MEFRLLGPLEVCDQERVLELGGAKRRALLALLALHANEVVSTDRLIEDLWGEQPPASAITALHGHVSRLRKLLNDQGSGKQLLRTRAPGYVLELSPDELDLHRFERLREQARALQGSGNLADAAARLREALALWRGPPLADLAYERFARDEAPRLEELRLAAVEERIEIELALGRHGDLTAELEALVAQHPLRETFVRQHMLALYRAGRQAEALEVYQQGRHRLVEELGIEPGRRLRDLHQAMLRQDPALDPFTRPETVGVAHGTGFVGHERELAELSAGLDDALAGRGRLFLLVGEPGIGKSRIAEEVAGRARARGAEVLVGRCWEAGGAPAYWPWVQALRMRLDDPDLGRLRAQLGGGAAEIAQILPELAELLPSLPEADGRAAEGERLRLFDAVAGFLRRASAHRPIVLVLDDLHAADTPSLLLLQFLARELGSSRVLLVGAYRDVEPVPGQKLTAMLAEVVREPVTRRLWLRGLDEQEVGQYVELNASELAVPELVAALHEETEGNPLFVTEMVRLLALEGFTTGGRITIPQSVREVIARRLAHLSDECNRTLVVASVLGREFALDSLARVSGVSEDELLETLDEAMAARVVSEVPDGSGRLRFAHVLIRDTLYEGLTTARRIRLHRLAVEALEALHGEDSGPHLAELAHHAAAGGDADTAWRYARRAGDRALTLLAYEEAARLYESALSLFASAARGDERARCELLLALGEAEARAGSSEASQRAFVEAADAARRLGLGRELARAALGYGGKLVVARAGRDARLVPLLEEGLAALSEDDADLRVKLLARLAGALRDERSRARRDSLSSEAVELARTSKNAAALAFALDGRVAAILAPDSVGECLALGTELRDLAQQIGEREFVGHGLVYRVHAQVQLGEIRGALGDLAAAKGIAEELKQPVLLWDVLGIEAMLALATGFLAEGERLAAEALAVGERAQPGMALPVARLQRYTLCELRGRFDGIEPEIKALIAEHPGRPVFRCVNAHLHAMLGRLPEAKAAIDALAADDFAALPFDAEWLYGTSLLAEACALIGDTDHAETLYRLLLPWKELNVADIAEGVRGSAARYLGLLAGTIERWEDAARHLEEALDLNRRMGLRPWLARTQFDYGRMLLERNRRGDRAAAAQAFSDARAAYEELAIDPARLDWSD